MEYKKGYCECGKELIIEKAMHIFYRYKVVKGELVNFYADEPHGFTDYCGWYCCPKCQTSYHSVVRDGVYSKGKLMRRKGEGV